MPGRHYERTVHVAARPAEVFAFADDHSRLSSHMNGSSWMMGGSRMTVEFDAANGQAIGAHIRLRGRVFGVQLDLDEVVTQREPPSLKVWETVGTPRLLVIGGYRMGVRVTPSDVGASLQVFIDYDLPPGPITRWLGVLFGGLYAKWCVSQMLGSAVRHFRAALSRTPQT